MIRQPSTAEVASAGLVTKTVAANRVELIVSVTSLASQSDTNPCRRLVQVQFVPRFHLETDQGTRHGEPTHPAAGAARSTEIASALFNSPRLISPKYNLRTPKTHPCLLPRGTRRLYGGHCFRRTWQSARCQRSLTLRASDATTEVLHSESTTRTPHISGPRFETPATRCPLPTRLTNTSQTTAAGLNPYRKISRFRRIVFQVFLQCQDP